MEQYHHKINFTLPSEIKQVIAKKENNSLKDGENIKEIKNKIPNKKKKISSKSLYNGHNNLKFNLNIKTDEAKINNQYSKICNKIEEEKKNLQSLNKIIKIHNNNIQTENNYYYSCKCNNSKNKNNQKKNLNKNLNLKKSTFNSIKRKKNFENNSEILLELNSNYNTNDDNKSFINIMSKRKINDNNSKNKNLYNQYITVNQNNKNNKNNKNKKSTNPKTILETNNKKISNNNFIERKTLNLPNNDCNNILINNNENSIYEKENNFEDNNDGDIKLIKINNLNKNIYKYDSSSTIHYSPNKFYHNIINYKQTNHFINIKNYNKYNNEQNIDNNITRKIHKQKSESKSNNAFNNQYSYNRISKNESFPRKKKKIMRNFTNGFNIYEKIENPKYNTRTSIPLNYLVRNTINYMNSKEKKKDKKAFTVNELFRRDSIPKTLSINSIEYESQATNPSIIPSKTNFTRKYFYQNTDNNIKIRQRKNKDINEIKFFKKIRMPNNSNSEHIFRINRENQNHISINDNSISNYNTEFIDNNYDINNTENIDIHYYKKKIYNISIPKTNTMDDLYSSNILNNLKPAGNLFSSKESYLDFNTMNKSRTNTACSRKKIFVKKDNFSPQKKLSNSIVFKDRDNTSYETDFHNKNSKNEQMKVINRNNKINKDNFCYVKKNTTILNEKDNNKLETNLIRMNETKYNFIIQNFNSDEKVLTSRSLKKNYKFNENEAIIYNTNTEEKVPTRGRIVYTKPLKHTSTSKTKTINNNLIKQNLNRKKYSLNNSIESFNNIENNSNINYSKKPLHLKKIIKNNFNYILKTEKRNKIVKSENEEKETSISKNNCIKKEISVNSKKKDISTYEDNTDFLNYRAIDKSKIHCHYTKLYNYYITLPIKKESYIEKVRNDKFIEFNSFNENLNMKDTLELTSKNKNVAFNGKNIISKIDNLNESNNLKTNGSEEIININFESFGENKNILDVSRISPKNINKNKTDYKTSRNEIKEEKTPNKDLYALLDNNNNNNIIQNNRNKFSNSTKSKFFKKDDLSRKLQICLATNKLSNIFITKKEKDDIPKRRATTEEKFALGCSKLFNIFRRKSPPPNIMYKNLYLNEYQNIQIKKNNNMINESESSMEIIDNKIINKLSKMNKKSYTYIPKKRQILSENNQNSTKYNNEDKDFEEEENNKKMKTQIINLLNIVNMNNLNAISGNISDIILFYDCDYCKNMNISKKKISRKYMDNENVFINAIFNIIIVGKCDLSLYAQLCKKINLFVFKEIKNRKNVNREENLFDKMIKEYYKRLYDKEYYNNINSDNEKELNIVQNKFIYLTNFISELILCKLVKKNESVHLIKELYNEYEKYDNNIKYIFLKGSILLLESLLDIIFQYQNCDDVLLDLENFIKNQLNYAINDRNISNDLKNKVYEIKEKFNEFKEPIIDNKNKNINDTYLSQSDRIEKENDKLFNNSKNNNINTLKNNYYQEENGGKDINKISDTKNLVEKIKNINSEKIGYKYNIIEENENNQNANDYNITKNLFEINNADNNFDNKSEANNKILTYTNNSPNHKRKSKTKKKCKSTDKIKKVNNALNDIIDDNKIYELVSIDFDNYLEFLKNERIKIKNDFYVEINDKYNWKEIDDLIVVKKVKLEEIIKTFIQICKNRKDINKNDIFKATEYIKALIEYYTNTLSNNQIEIFHLYMIEIFMDINNIVENDDTEIMHEIMGNLLFILLKNKLYYIKDLNNFIDKTEETKINIAKVVKYAIIASGNFSKQYHNDFKYTKLFNNSDLFVNYVTNELGDINKK